ncbi:MAG: hypothetical protein PWR27_649 [Petroclostridium sp.]|uniref:sugar-binding protein n=1 Tax=Petroclostridium xylanilyticum TaxID=1792311 RepID=UPI0012FFCEE1|nr:sugar-binding protein [Petroclostridium xylanilyticum]MBZ4646595.1 LacI family transcriptional regulator [Clostridia bacterium]MDK2809940.1 hypothetical protein [Petroclostridium sp.]
MKKLILSIIILLPLVALIFLYNFLFSFHKNNTENKKYDLNKFNERYYFTLISHSLGNPYWERVRKGAEDAANEIGVTLEYTGPTESNLTEELRLIEIAIAVKVDGIITHVFDEQQFMPVINKAIEKGIPVITIDTDAPKSKRISYVGTDNYDAGTQAGKILAQLLKGKGNVGIITGNFEPANLKQRVDGFKSVMERYPNINIVDIQSSNISLLGATEKAQFILANNNVDALYCTSSLDPIGAARVVVSRGLQGRVKIVGFDDLPDTLEYIKQEVVDATLAQQPYKMGNEAVKRMYDFKKGKSIPASIHTPVEPITKHNVQDYQKTVEE